MTFPSVGRLPYAAGYQKRYLMHHAYLHFRERGLCCGGRIFHTFSRSTKLLNKYGRNRWREFKANIQQTWTRSFVSKSTADFVVVLVHIPLNFAFSIRLTNPTAKKTLLPRSIHYCLYKWSSPTRFEIVNSISRKEHLQKNSYITANQKFMRLKPHPQATLTFQKPSFSK